MSDIVTRLRGWRNVHLARLHLLMEEAADEMERLSANGDCPVADNAANGDNTPATHGTPSEGREQGGCTLTAEERGAVERAIDAMNGVEDISASWSQREAEAIATLRGLLEQTK